MHLNDAILRRLLDRSLTPGEAKALSEHLGQDCEVCEAFLAQSSTADAVDGLVDRALADASPGEAGNDLEYARIERRLQGLRRTRAPLVAGLAVAAALLAVGGVAIRLAGEKPAAQWDGFKGVPSEFVPAKLGFVVARGAGSSAQLEKGAPGMKLGRDQSLLFRVEVSKAADVALVRIGPSGEPDAFFHERFEAAGQRDVTSGDRPAAYRLEDLAGQQRFVLVASPRPLSAERIAAAALALKPPDKLSAEAPALDGLSLDVVEVTVK
jgi:hypothetical protein